MGEFQDEVNDYFGKSWGKAILTGFVVLAVYLAASFFWGIWPFSVARDVAHKVVNAESIINNYEFFYDKYASIQAQEANIRATSKDDSVRPGMILVYNNNVSEYNAKSREITRNLWKADDLPYQIEFFKE